MDGSYPKTALLLTLVTLSLAPSTEGITTGRRTGGHITSNKANEFHIAFMQHYVNPSISAYSYFVLNRSTLLITTDEPNNITVVITYNGSDNMYLVGPEAVKQVQLTNVRVGGPADRNKGIRIKAEGNSLVSVFTMDEELYSIEGYSALHCSQIPHVAHYKYYAISVPQTTTIANTTADSAFLVVACGDNTTVTVTPTQDVANPDDVSRKIKAGDSFTTVLHDSQTLYVESRDDLTGSFVVSDSPITFLSGHECGNVPYNVADCNKLVEQLPPTLMWGSNFFTAPTANRRSSDTIKILAAESDTEIDIICASNNSSTSQNLSVTISSAGGFINFTTSPEEYCHIESDKAILVVQFTPGKEADPSRGSKGNPFMAMVPAVSQYLNNITFTTLQGPGLLFTNYLNIYVPASYFDNESIQLDGNHISNVIWVPITCVSGDICGYAAQVQLVVKGLHRVSHANPNATLGVTVYGMDYYHTVAYAYVGGLSLSRNKDLMIVEPVQTSFVILCGSSICFSCEVTPGYLDPSQANWDLRRGNGSFIDGRQVKKFTNGTLCIENASTLDSGQYTCTIGMDNLTYSLSVLAGIVVQPPTCRPELTTNQTVLLGIGMSASAIHVDLTVSTLEICCVAALPVDRLTWLANGEEVLTGQNGYTIGADYLRAQGPFTDECIVYTCQATFSSGNFQETSEVCYGNFGPPTFVMISGSQNVLEGSAATVECSASGFPQPVLVWMLDPHSELSLSSRGHDFGNGTLHVRALYENDTDIRFCCMAANERGVADMCTNFKVLVPPEIQLPGDGNPAVIPAPPGVSLPLPYNVTITAEIGQEVMIVETYRLELSCTITRGSPVPTVSWLHNGALVSTGDGYQVWSEISGATLLIESVTSVRDSGTFTCKAEIAGVGYAEMSSTVTVIEPPKVAEPLSPLHAPGNCRDLTNVTIATARVGLNLCVLASSESRLYLECTPAQGFPAPTTEWFKDGEKINSSSVFVILSNGTLLIQSILHPIESSATGVPGVMGLYTCLLSNVAGAANTSSYIVPFGDISPESVAAYYAPLQMELFSQLYQHISSSTTKADESLALVAASGKILKHEDYYPGRYYDGGEDTIPPRIMENMFDLVDIIPNAASVVTAENGPSRASLSMTYEYLVRELKVAPPDVDHNTLTEARAHLQELVSDVAAENNTTLPRLSLYLLYKNKYYLKKLEIENQIDNQRRRLPGLRFSQWYERNGIILENEVVGAYSEWEVYGNKNDTETWLDILNLHDHSEPLNEARALLFATMKSSKYRDEKVYFPVEFYPNHWFDFLTNRVKESVEQLQYLLAELQTQKRVLEFTHEFLETKLRRRELGFWERPPVVYDQLEAASFFLENEVLNSEQQRYQCLVTRNPIDCQLYAYEHDIVLQLMEIFADLYWEAEFIKTATDHRDVSIPLVLASIASIEKEIDRFDLFIRVALLDSADREAEDEDVASEIEFEQTFANFLFSTKEITQNGHDFVVSEQIRKRPLWYIDPHSTSLTSSKTLEDYSRTLSHLNSMWTNITARFIKVEVHRRWLKPGLFGNNHLKMRNESILVSPGLVEPLKNLRSLLENNSYELPVYPSSLILATEVEIFVHLPFPFHTLPTLLRLSYDQHVRGGFGPFSFGPLFLGKANGIKFQVQVRDNGVVILLPGTQLIGYVCNIVPQHPPEAHVLSNRRRRSTFTASGSYDVSEQDISSSKFGQWLTEKTKYSSSDASGELEKFRASERLLLATRGDRGQSGYSQRLQHAVSLKKFPPSSQLQMIGVYSNLSAPLSLTNYAHGKTEIPANKNRGKYA